jgi:hypothetical protein
VARQSLYGRYGLMLQYLAKITRCAVLLVMISANIGEADGRAILLIGKTR